MGLSKYGFYVKGGRKNKFSLVRKNNLTQKHEAPVFKNLDEDSALGFIHAIDLGWITEQGLNKIINKENKKRRKVKKNNE